jgi:hypothetical protein
MQLSCPKCGTREIRISHKYGFGEHFKALFGVSQLRCRRCRTRWSTSVWAEGAWRYARCPRCYRQQLTTWSEQYYHPPRWTTFQLRIGATPYRCAACRCNFASFKPCKEKFSWRHETKVEVGSSPTAPPAAVSSKPDRSEGATRDRAGSEAQEAANREMAAKEDSNEPTL